MRASRGWTGNRSMRRPSGVMAAPSSAARRGVGTPTAVPAGRGAAPPVGSTAPSRTSSSSAAVRGGLGRWLEPARARPARRARRRSSSSAALGEVGARDLGHLERAPGVVVVPGVQADHAAGAGAAGAAGALGAAGAADRLDLQRRQAGPRRVPRDPRQAAVDHADHAVDRHRGLGDVGREDHLALAARGAPRGPARRPAGRRTAAARRGRRSPRPRRGRPGSAGSRPAPGRNTRTSPSSLSWASRRTAAATWRPSGRSSGCSTCSIASANVRPSDRTTGAPPRNAATGSASSVADITTRRELGAAGAQPGDQREREVAVEVALVELVDDRRSRRRAARGRRAAGGSARPR